MRGERLEEGSSRCAKLAFYMTKAGWRRSGRFLVEGPQAVREAIRTGGAVDVYFDELAPLPAEFKSGNGAYFHPSCARALEKISKDCQGVVATARVKSLERGLSSLDLSGTFLMAALWQVRDPGNEGTIIRTCDGAGCRAVLLVGECASIFNPKVIRSSAGSLFHIPVARCSERELFSLKGRALILSTSGRGGGIADDGPSSLNFGKPLILLFGNEARGLPDSLLSKSDAVCSIPIFGEAESLNLSAAAGILVYDAARGLRMKGETHGRGF